MEARVGWAAAAARAGFGAAARVRWEEAVGGYRKWVPTHRASSRSRTRQSRPKELSRTRCPVWSSNRRMVRTPCSRTVE